MYLEVSCLLRLLYSIYTDREAQCNTTNNYTQSIFPTILVFLLLYSIRGFFVYFLLHVHVYIQASDPLMNTSAIHNMVTEPQIRVRSSNRRP
jgi:hypothetical protein